MRKYIVAGNWKMNNTYNEGMELCKEILENGPELEGNHHCIIAAPFIHLASLSSLMNGSGYQVAAQNCHEEEKGAFTGEVSASMLSSVGVEYVILGHSERREYQGENDAMLLNKVKQVLAKNMTPIFCFGEQLAEREGGNHFDLVKRQIEGVLFHLSVVEVEKIILAYEPVWAIGTGKTASSAEAEEMHAFVRSLLIEKFGNALGEKTTILYGGSCKPSNADELFACPNVDGGLIGGASLKSADFIALVTALQNAKS